MIDRSLRVQFRLTPKEYQQLAPLIRERGFATWSSLVRVALFEFWERNPTKTTSDNGVRHELQSETPPLFRAVAKKRTGRGTASRRRKSKV